MIYLLPYDVFYYDFVFYYVKLMTYKMFHNVLPWILKVHGGLFYESSELINFMIFMHNILTLHDLKFKCLNLTSFTLCPNEVYFE